MFVNGVCEQCSRTLFVFVYVRSFVGELWLCVREQAVFANVHEHVRSLENFANIKHCRVLAILQKGRSCYNARATTSHYPEELH